MLRSAHSTGVPLRSACLAWCGLMLLLALRLAPAFAEEPRRVRVDVRDVPLLELTLYFSELTGQNFVLLDKDLEDRRITIYAPQPVTIDEARDLFIAALQLHGLVVFDDGAFWKVTREPLGGGSDASHDGHRAGGRAAENGRHESTGRVAAKMTPP